MFTSIVFGFAIGVLAGAITLGSVAAFAVAFASTVFITYVALPTLALNYFGTWVIAFAGLSLGTGACSICGSGWAGRGNPTAGVAITVGSFALLALAYFFTTASVFHADAYAALIGKVETVRFSEAMQPLDIGGRHAPGRSVIDQDNVRLVDSGIAYKRAVQLLGSDPELGGTFALGDMQLTTRQGRLVYAGPLEYTGYFRSSGHPGSPGYVWVDAHDERQAALVREANGAPIRMRCLESTWFGSNMERSVWNQGFQSTGLTEWSFEIDSNGSPMYSISAFDNKVGFGGADVTGVVLFDPQTCVAKFQPLGDVPSWVNRVVPQSMIDDQLSDWGGFHAHGWMNQTMFGSHADVLQTTPGMEIVRTTRSGDLAFYDGLTTPGNPDGTTGFALVDARTKKTTYFELSGTTEVKAAEAMIHSIAQMTGYTADSPILYSVPDGSSERATYLSIIKDAAGNFKKVGLMPVNDLQAIVVSDDLPTALAGYAQLLSKLANSQTGIASAATSVAVDGVVLRFSQEVVDGKTIYFFTLDGYPNTVFRASNGLGAQVGLTRPGDAVSIAAHGQRDTGIFDVNRLDNVAVLPPISTPDFSVAR